jgi:anti-sigma B factor antagonist
VDIQLRQLGSVIVLDLSGKVTLGEGIESLLTTVTDLVETDGARQLLINLENVPYMDSSGISTLILCHRCATRGNATMKLLNTKKRVYDLLQVVKLDSIFPCFSDEQEAIASFSS